MYDTAKLLSISKVLEKMIHHTANDIFNTYRDKFLIMEVTYIVPAVWGAIKNGELDETQKEIHKKTNKLVEDSITTFFLKDPAEPQAYAIRYLVNMNIIYYISYSIETTKNKLCQGKINTENMLKNMEPPGLLS